MQKLSRLKRPFLCSVITETTSSRAIDVIDASEREGTDAFEINLAQLQNKTQQHLKDIIGSTTKPCIVTCRRADFMRLYGFPDIQKIDEDVRAANLLLGLETGASALDFELDIFDNSDQYKKPRFGSRQEWSYAQKANSRPTQMTNNRHAIKKQLELVKQGKSLGCEVMISSHTQCRIRERDIIKIARIMKQR